MYFFKCFSVRPENFINREFSFTLHEDIYIRYQSFNTLQEFEKEVQNRCPFKIDVGAVFNMRFVYISFLLLNYKSYFMLFLKIFYIIGNFCSPKVCRNYPQFHAIEKELVIDIDMTDYDSIRTCCSGAEVCQKCWRLILKHLNFVPYSL